MDELFVNLCGLGIPLDDALLDQFDQRRDVVKLSLLQDTLKTKEHVFRSSKESETIKRTFNLQLPADKSNPRAGQTFFSQLLVVNQFAVSQIVQYGTKVSRVSVNHVRPCLILLEEKSETQQTQQTFNMIFHSRFNKSDTFCNILYILTLLVVVILGSNAMP